MKHIAIFASGTGSNATKIVEYFKTHVQIRVKLIVSNKSKAPVLKMAEKHHIDTLIIDRKSFYETEEILIKLQNHQIDFIALAGFLWLIPDYLIRAFQGNLVNIHPALLPKFGGKGMYGMNIHRAVRAANEKESGITIHQVNENYDDGGIIFQAKCPLSLQDTPEQIAEKVLKLEHQYFAPVIEKQILGITSL